MIEDFSVWRLRETLPNRTTPRLQNVLQYIMDIGWIKREGKVYTITEAGTKIIGGV
jgi:predicted transcriptional regulator